MSYPTLFLPLTFYIPCNRMPPPGAVVAAVLRRGRRDDIATVLDHYGPDLVAEIVADLDQASPYEGWGADMPFHAPRYASGIRAIAMTALAAAGWHLPTSGPT